MSYKGGHFSAGTQPSSIAIHPRGQFAFAADFGSNDITTLTITGTDFGLAVSLGQSGLAAAGLGPSSVAVDSSGKFLYVTNRLSNDVSVFTVDASTGGLKPISGSPFTVGTAPVSVTASM